MLLLEHDAKELLRAAGLPVPAGAWMQAPAPHADDLLPGVKGPWIVKAQVPAGGRGKAGGIRPAATWDAVNAHVAALVGQNLVGHRVRGVRVEQAVEGAQEFYLSLGIDAARAAVSVMLSPQGGVDVEQAGTLWRASAELDPASLHSALDGLAERLPPAARGPVRAVAGQLAQQFLAWECVLLEINPLFVLPDSRVLIGDAKLQLDVNALPRLPALSAFVLERAERYPEVALKLNFGFDYVELDHGGDIGVLTSGAGIGMQTVDELAAQGGRPFNFLDLRGGQLKGDPARLVQVLGWIAAGPGVKVVFMNLFAGLTDMEAFARLFVAAIGQVPQMRVPIVTRLQGRNAEGAQRVFSQLPTIVFEADIDAAIRRAVDIARAAS